VTPASEPARILDGAALAQRIRAGVGDGCRRLRERRGVVPGLTVVLVGEDAASQIYVRNKEKAARAAGMESHVVRLPTATSERELLGLVGELNADPAVHGILVQLPLPEGIDSQRVIEALDPDKDVDGFHPLNAGRLFAGLPGLLPCTPAGILRLLEHHEIPLAGKRAVVLGRSNIVGKPLALLLLRRNCTVTICHSRTTNLAEIAASADVLVAAIGRPGLVTGEMIKPGAAVVDVGIHRVSEESECRRLYGDDPERLAAVRERGGTLVGDVHPLEARRRAGWLSPVPGGVGPLTIALLLENTLAAAERAATSVH